MTLEVEMPHPDMPGMKQKGRVYVCDLAGTEPAGDIVYALYEKKVIGHSCGTPTLKVDLKHPGLLHANTATAMALLSCLRWSRFNMPDSMHFTRGAIRRDC